MGLAVLFGLHVAAYSQAQSRYCSTRGLLPAAFPPWADPSLLRNDLVGQASARTTISMPSLPWTPARHRSTTCRTPELKRSTAPGLQCHWITGARHNAQPAP